MQEAYYLYHKCYKIFIIILDDMLLNCYKTITSFNLKLQHIIHRELQIIK